MKDNISTRIVFERALQLGYRYPLDVRSCKAQRLTCQEALYRNSEQQNATLEANCHTGKKHKKKWKGLGKKKSSATTEKNRHGRLERWNQEADVKGKHNLNTKKYQIFHRLEPNSEGFCCLEEKYVPVWKSERSFQLYFFFYKHSHLVVALYNPPPTAGQTVMPLKQIEGVKCFTSGHLCGS